MKAQIYKNVDLVEIPITAGQEEYFLPQNTDWAHSKIDKIMICAPAKDSVSPTDGQTPVMTASKLQDLYVNLYADSDKELMHDAHFSLLSHTNNHPVEINSKLNLSLCRLYFTTTPDEDAVLLMYVFYDGKEVEDYEEPQKSVTFTVDLEPDERKNFQQLINTYVYALPARIKGIEVWDAENTPAYLMLRDHQLSYILRDVHSELLRPRSEQYAAATGVQVHPFRLQDADIDFDYSYVRNASSDDAAHLTITLYY